MIKPWKENGTLKIAREGKCVDAYLNKMPLENLLDKDNLSAYTAKEFKRLLAKRDVKLNYEQLEWVKNSLGYEDRKEIFGTKKAKIISLGLSDENWQTLIEQIGDDLSFAYQSMSILYEVSDSDNSTLGKQKESYEKCIKKLDDAYKKYVKSLGGISVSETAKANYELTKQVLTDGMAQLEQPIAEEKEQKRIAAEKAKKEAAEAKEEKFRKDLVSKAFKGNEEKAEIFFNSASKNIDKNKDLNAMYFPNGAKVCFTWQFGPDCTEYITPILVVYQDIKWDSYRQVSDGTSSDETYNWGYNVYIYNAEGKLIEKKEKTTDGLDVKDRKEPEKYKLSASKGGWNWKHRGGC